MPSDVTDYRTPGQLIQALLERNDWSQRTLAIVLGVGEPTISKIIAGTQSIDAPLALALSDLFDVPAENFMELQQSYDLALARIATRPDPGRANRAHLFGKLPIGEMIKRGWVLADDVRNVAEVEQALAAFFGVKSPEEIEILPHAAKKTDVVGEVTPVQRAWLHRVKQIAKELLVRRYSPVSVESAVAQLRPLRASREAVRKVPRILAESGIRFVIVEALSGSKIDGVCFWLDDNSPVIGMSLRYDRIDNFWFVLRHELEHVIRLHGREAAIVDAELEGERAGVGPNIPEEERLANEAAAEFCVPKKSMDSFIARKFPLVADRDLVGLARSIQVHPGLVAGQLQHRTNKFDRFRTHLVKIRSAVTPSAIVDGWGDVYPVD